MEDKEKTTMHDSRQEFGKLLVDLLRNIYNVSYMDKNMTPIEKLESLRAWTRGLRNYYSLTSPFISNKDKKRELLKERLILMDHITENPNQYKKKLIGNKRKGFFFLLKKELSSIQEDLYQNTTQLLTPIVDKGDEEFDVNKALLD